LRIDIGCGAPDQKYPGCIGLDVNPNYEPDILHDCDQGLPFEDDSVEFVASDHSLEHVKQPYKLLCEVYRVLEPGGTFRLVLPNARFLPITLVNIVWDLDSAWHWYMSLPFKKDRTVHWTHFSRNLILRMVEDVGFRVESVEGNMFTKSLWLRLTKDAEQPGEDDDCTSGREDASNG